MRMLEKLTAKAAPSARRDEPRYNIAVQRGGPGTILGRLDLALSLVFTTKTRGVQQTGSRRTKAS